MTAAGWVERRPDPNDRRAVRLFLTEKAQPILANMRAAGTLFQEQALAGISAAERQQLIELLGRIKANLSKPLDAPKPQTESTSNRAGAPRAAASPTK
jgi:DNA-binding MarR family transcriptional regulator